LNNLAKRLAALPGWVLTSILWSSAALLSLALLSLPVREGRTGMMNLTESWGALDRLAMWQDHLSFLPGVGVNGGAIQLPPLVVAWLVRLGFLGLYVAFVGAILRVWNGDEAVSIRPFLAGAIGAHLLLLLVVPSNADIFFYAMSGDLARQGINPYVHYLYEFPGNPLLPYNHWTDMTTVYGPLWTLVDRAVVTVTGNDPFRAALGLKIVLGAFGIGLAFLCRWIVEILGGTSRTSTFAFVFVAWNPIILFETSGQAHNDVVVSLLSTAGVGLALVGGIRAIRGALVLIAMSSAVKYVTLPILGLAGLVPLVAGTRDSWARRFGQTALNGCAVIAVFIAAFAPFWSGFATIREMLLEPGRLFAHPLWLLPYFGLLKLSPSGADVYVSIMRVVLQLVTVGLLGLVLVRFVKHIRQVDPDIEIDRWRESLMVAWMAIMAVLALVPANSHAWYWTWTVAPFAIGIAHLNTPGRELPRWFGRYLVLMMTMTLIYHTRIVHT
jgi:hypothetical protein